MLVELIYKAAIMCPHTKKQHKVIEHINITELYLLEPMQYTQSYIVKLSKPGQVKEP